MIVQQLLSLLLKNVYVFEWVETVSSKTKKFEIKEKQREDRKSHCVYVKEQYWILYKINKFDTYFIWWYNVYYYFFKNKKRIISVM